MKLISFTQGGRATFGAVVGDRVVDLGQRSDYPDLRSALEADALDELARIVEDSDTDYAYDKVDLLPTIPNPDKIIAAGRNYKDHVIEMDHPLPENLSLFVRLTNTLVAHGETIERPKVSTNFDFEGELALVIGKPGRHIAREDVLSHIAGYTCFLDGSIRDYQKHSVTAGKNFYRTGPLGPWMVTADEVPDPGKLQLTTRLNGEVVQDCGTDLLIFDVPYIVSYISDFTPLVPGDVIATGTPAGVGNGRTPQLWMKDGDVIEVDISSVGVLRNTVVDEK